MVGGGVQHELYLLWAGPLPRFEIKIVSIHHTSIFDFLHHLPAHPNLLLKLVRTFSSTSHPTVLSHYPDQSCLLLFFCQIFPKSMHGLTPGRPSMSARRARAPPHNSAQRETRCPSPSCHLRSLGALCGFKGRGLFIWSGCGWVGGQPLTWTLPEALRPLPG